MRLEDPSARDGLWGVLLRLLADARTAWVPRSRERRPGRDASRSEGRATRRYQALLDLPADRDVTERLPWPTWRAALRVPHQRPDPDGLFSALVSGGADVTPRPDTLMTVTLVVVGPRPAEYPEIGDEFTLWRGAEVAHGVITNRLFV